MDIEFKEERVGKQWLITSAQLPGLYVADTDLETARKAVPAAVAMLDRMTRRRDERDRISKLARKE